MPLSIRNQHRVFFIASIQRCSVGFRKMQSLREVKTDGCPFRGGDVQKQTKIQIIASGSTRTAFFFFFNPSIDSSSAVFARPLAQLASCFISEDRNENCPRLFNIVGIKAFTLILTSLHIRCSFSGSNRKFKNADD